MIDNGAIEQQEGRGERLLSAMSRIFLTRPHNRDKDTPILESFPPMPEGTELHLYSLFEIEHSRVRKPEIIRELQHMAPVVLQIHDEIMSSRIINRLGDLGVVIPALFTGATAETFDRLIQKRMEKGDEFDEFEVEKVKTALRENKREWRNEDAYISRPASGFGSHITSLDIIQRTDEEERTVRYWIRNVTSNVNAYAEGERKTTATYGDSQFPGTKYESILIGRKDQKDAFQKIGPCNQIKKDAETAKEPLGDFLKSAGYTQIWRVELKKVSASKPIAE